MNSSASLTGQLSTTYFGTPSSAEFLPRSAGPSASGAMAQSTLSFDDRLILLRQHGAFTLDYSAAFQEGLEYLCKEQGQMIGGTAFALGDPAGEPTDATFPHATCAA